MAFYSTLRSAYLNLVPERLRRITLDTRYPLYHVFRPLRSTLQHFASHDDIYDERYFADIVEPRMRESAEIMASTISRLFHPAVVVDVGCGTGELLRAFKAINIDVQGFERAEAALKIARSKGVSVSPLDLEQPLDKLEVRRADVVISTEVAEHLPKAFAGVFVEYLCRTADTVVITAATPGQGGTDHVNEQPNEYWIDKFHAREYGYDTATTMKVREEWKAADVISFYYMNIMIFRKKAA